MGPFFLNCWEDFGPQWICLIFVQGSLNPDPYLALIMPRGEATSLCLQCIVPPPCIAYAWNCSIKKQYERSGGRWGGSVWVVPRSGASPLLAPIACVTPCYTLPPPLFKAQPMGHLWPSGGFYPTCTVLQHLGAKNNLIDALLGLPAWV